MWILFFHFKNGRDGMAFPTTDVWIEAGATGLFTKSLHPDARLKTGFKWAAHLCAQAHKFAGIGPVNGWHRAGAAKSGLPVCADQAAFFMLAAAIIVAKEIFTFRAGRSFHIFNFSIDIPLTKNTTKTPSHDRWKILGFRQVTGLSGLIFNHEFPEFANTFLIFV
jgi:hypothetical protein